MHLTDSGSCPKIIEDYIVLEADDGFSSHVCVTSSHVAELYITKVRVY